MEKLSRFLDAGDHSSAFYKDTEETFKIIVPYFRAGILLGEKCLLIGKIENFEKIEKQIRESSEPEFIQNIARSLDFVSHHDYVIQMLTKKKNPEIIIGQWRNIIEKYLAEGFKAVRLAGIFPPNFSKKLQTLILQYEKSAASLFRQYPVSAVCLYPAKVKNTPFGKEICSIRYHPVRVKKINV